MAIIKCDGVDCWAHLDWHCEHAGLARVFMGSQKLGDPYCYALPFVVRTKFARPDAAGRIGLIEFVGVTTVMKPCQYRVMRAAIREAGYGILSTRIRDGEKRTIEICKRGWQPQR